MNKAIRFIAAITLATLVGYAATFAFEAVGFALKEASFMGGWIASVIFYKVNTPK